MTEATHRARPAKASRIVRDVTDLEMEAILKDLTLVTSWPQGLQDFLLQHPDCRLPSKPSAKNIGHQVISIFASNLGLAFKREHLRLIGEKLGKSAGSDPIQWANKIEQVGLRLDKSPGRSPGYGFQDLCFSDKYLASRTDLTTEVGRNDSVARSRRLFQEMADGAYEKGHRDPRLPLSDGNLVMQPQEINRSYKDRYIFDDNGLPTVPNPVKFAEDPTVYYSDEADRRIIYEALSKEFAPRDQ